MKEKMTFLPKKEILSLEEIERMCDNFIDLGVNKIRLTVFLKNYWNSYPISLHCFTLLISGLFHLIRKINIINEL